MNISSIEILQILLIFIIYSFLGWLLESITKSIVAKCFINSGFLYGPLCPIYGCGAIIMIALLSEFKNNILILFLVSFIILSAWEYLVGWLLEKIFKTKYWDYSKNKFNLQGRICLKNSIYWGILGVIFILFIHPCIENITKQIPFNGLIYIDIVLYIAIITDTIISIVKINSINKGIEKLKELADTLKLKLEELKEINPSESLKNAENLIEELKQKQDNIKQEVYKKVNRLKKAFPTMKAENITQFLSQKIDIKRNKKNNDK